jgi:hypothetical protein
MKRVARPVLKGTWALAPSGRGETELPVQKKSGRAAFLTFPLSHLRTGSDPQTSHSRRIRYDTRPMPVESYRGSGRSTAAVARVVLACFLLAFVSARVLVLLIMTRHVPDLYVHAGGTHVHHLNFGIFLLSGVGAYLLFGRPYGRAISIAAGVYGVGLGLTFDEFGMWLHLGGPYWQRASFDAVIVIGALLALIAFAPDLRRFRARQWVVLVVLLALIGVLGYLTARQYGSRVVYRLQLIEQTAPQ